MFDKVTNRHRGTINFFVQPMLFSDVPLHKMQKKKNISDASLFFLFLYSVTCPECQHLQGQENIHPGHVIFTGGKTKVIETGHDAFTVLFLTVFKQLVRRNRIFTHFTNYELSRQFSGF